MGDVSDDTELSMSDLQARLRDLAQSLEGVGTELAIIERVIDFLLNEQGTMQVRSPRSRLPSIGMILPESSILARRA